MAGKTLYIGDMIANLQDKINEQVQELTEVSKTLTNIAANTGVTINQKAFTGATFSAVNLLTYNHDNAEAYLPPINNLKMDAVNSANSFQLNYQYSQQTVLTRIDLTNYKTLKGVFYITNLINQDIGTLYIYINNVEVKEVTFETSKVKSTEFEIDISAYTSMCNIEFKMSTPTKTTNYGVKDLLLINEATGEENNKFWRASECDLLAYNADNALAMASNNYGYAYGYVNYTAEMSDITIGTWSALIFQLNKLDGVKFAIVDAEGNVIKDDLIRQNAIDDLSTYNWYVRYELTDPDVQITGAILRYT